MLHHFPPENLLKTPKHAKKLLTPVQSARKALGVVNKITATPAASRQEMKPQKIQVRRNQKDFQLIKRHFIDEYVGGEPSLRMLTARLGTLAVKHPNNCTLLINIYQK